MHVKEQLTLRAGSEFFVTATLCDMLGVPHQQRRDQWPEKAGVVCSRHPCCWRWSRPRAQSSPDTQSWNAQTAGVDSGSYQEFVAQRINQCTSRQDCDPVKVTAPPDNRRRKLSKLIKNLKGPDLPLMRPLKTSSPQG